MVSTIEDKMMLCCCWRHALSYLLAIRDPCSHLLVRTDDNSRATESHKDTDLHMQPKNFDHDNCQNIAKHLVHFSALPVECRKYADVVAYTKSHDSDTSHPTQWLG